MTRWRFPEILGGGEHEDIGNHDTRVGFDLEGVSNRLWLETSDLTEVPPPIPAEPEPGAYLVGGRHVYRDEKANGARWVYGAIWWDWKSIWAKVGGPDVAIVPLVPAPKVKLPWKVTTRYGTDVTVGQPDEDGEIPVEFSHGATGVLLAAHTAEVKGWALISAARVAREAGNGSD